VLSAGQTASPCPAFLTRVAQGHFYLYGSISQYKIIQYLVARLSLTWYQNLSFFVFASISPDFIVGLAEWVFHHGIEDRRYRVRTLTTHIPLRVISPAYRSLYDGARIAQTSGPSEQSGGTVAGT
jgi:hypothetical protein